jgi:hypothetical protein
MPRDFVPCVYHERDLYHIAREVVQRRLEVIDVVSASLVHTHETVWLMTEDSRVFFTDPPAGDEAAARTRLFDTFYAACAALE